MLCCWAARKLGISTLELSKKLGISQPTASQSVKRGEKIVKEKGLELIGKFMPIYRYPYPIPPEYDASWRVVEVRLREKAIKPICRDKNLAAFIFFLLTVVFCSNADGSDIIISWAGNIEGITEFKDKALPAGIAVGDRVSGELCFDQSGYDKSTSILGNIFYGNRFYYYSQLQQSISINEWNWVIDGGIVTLSQSYNTESGFFDVYTDSSPDFEFIEFPNYVGNFELGYALKDDQQPIDIFNSFLLNTATLDFSKVTWGGGHISSREWNENGDIVDGYYITFEISETSISLSPAPESDDEDHSGGGCFISSL